MDVRPSSPKKVIKRDEVPIPTRTPKETIEHLLSLCINDEHQEFAETMDRLSTSSPPGTFAVRELGDVMTEAIKQDNVKFASTLLSYGLPIAPYFGWQATLVKAKGILEFYISAGWDINQPVGVLQPPVLA